MNVRRKDLRSTKRAKAVNRLEQSLPHRLCVLDIFTRQRPLTPTDVDRDRLTHLADLRLLERVSGGTRTFDLGVDL